MALPGARCIAGGETAFLILCDHASNAVPPGLDLGVPSALLEDHIAVDIGAGALAAGLAGRLGCPAVLGAWSRLVVDCNRAPGTPGLVPESSDGHVIPGNLALDDAAYAARLALHADFHAQSQRLVATNRPRLLVSVHSFTPALASGSAPRPWPVAVLWNQDARGAAAALAALRADPRIDGPVGANEPYSGRILNYSMDRHAEANRIAYVGFEVRQDGLVEPAGIARWVDILADALLAVDRTLGP
jgi:predicted N-formylglutamate amidohydrolase